MQTCPAGPRCFSVLIEETFLAGFMPDQASPAVPQVREAPSSMFNRIATVCSCFVWITCIIARDLAVPQADTNIYGTVVLAKLFSSEAKHRVSKGNLGFLDQKRREEGPSFGHAIERDGKRERVEPAKRNAGPSQELLLSFRNVRRAAVLCTL